MERESPDGSGVRAEARDEAYCYGGVSFFDYYEDPIWINVAETGWDIAFDGYWNYPSFPWSPSCYAKDAGAWPPPANTQWYIQTCSVDGYDGSMGFDRYALTSYINWDWWDNDDPTGVVLQPGVQYTMTIPAHLTFYSTSWGEDYDYLSVVQDDWYDYICWW